MSFCIASVTDEWELGGDREVLGGGWYFIGFLDLRSHCL